MKKAFFHIRERYINITMLQTSWISKVKSQVFGGFIQIRTATKRVSGSRTNKNDSAGRRLGPKVMENGFVKPGQIIMRQRGTKLHPGENVGIGKDHTIFALEPGFVKYYLDPFHPLRKFVGVSLKRDVSLPKPHFAPRLRRFGHEVIENESVAKAEEERMSRKEYLAQDELKAQEQEREAKFKELVEEMTKVVEQELPGYEKSSDAISRLANIGGLIRAGQSYQDAKDQVTFNTVFDIQLANRKGEISTDDMKQKINEYRQFADHLDTKLCVDFKAKAHKPYTNEERENKSKELTEKLNTYTNIVLHSKEKSEIIDIIETPGIFSKEERSALKDHYIPRVLPESVPGTVLEIKSKKLPKDAIMRRVFNPETRQIQTTVRSKEAFPRDL